MNQNIENFNPGHGSYSSYVFGLHTWRLHATNNYLIRRCIHQQDNNKIVEALIWVTIFNRTNDSIYYLDDDR